MTLLNYSIEKLPFRYHKKEYLLTYLAIALYNPTFSYYGVFHFIFLLISIYFFYKERLSLDPTFFIIILTLFALSLGQTLTLGSFQFTSFIGLYLTFLLPYFIIRILGNRFYFYFINITYFFAIIALIFWTLQNILPGFTNILINISQTLKLDPISNESIIIYNLEYFRPDIDILGLMKNAGFTAEGGVYSGLLIVALFFNTLINITIFDKKNTIFILSIITTTSTAGYAALFVLIIGFSISLKKNLYKFLLFPVLLVSIYTIIFELPFLYQKVTKYYQDEKYVYDTNVGAMRLGRFNSAMIELEVLPNHIIFGRGIYKIDRALSTAEADFGISGTQLGIINLLSRYGLPFFIVFMTLLFLAFKDYAIKNNERMLFGMSGLISWLLINVGQVMLASPLGLILIYSSAIGLTKNKLLE